MCTYIDRISRQILENEREPLFELFGVLPATRGSEVNMQCQSRRPNLSTYVLKSDAVTSVCLYSFGLDHPSIHPSIQGSTFIHSFTQDYARFDSILPTENVPACLSPLSSLSLSRIAEILLTFSSCYFPSLSHVLETPALNQRNTDIFQPFETRKLPPSLLRAQGSK